MSEGMKQAIDDALVPETCPMDAEESLMRCPHDACWMTPVTCKARSLTQPTPGPAASLADPDREDR